MMHDGTYTLLFTAAMLAFSYPVGAAFRSAYDFAREPQHRLIPGRSARFYFFYRLRHLNRWRVRGWLLLCLVFLFAGPLFLAWANGRVRPSIAYRSQFLIGGFLGFWMINLAACIAATPRFRSAFVVTAIMIAAGWGYIVGLDHLHRASLNWQNGFFMNLEVHIPLLNALAQNFYLEPRPTVPLVVWLRPYERHWFNATVPVAILLSSVLWAKWRGDRYFRIE